MKVPAKPLALFLAVMCVVLLAGCFLLPGAEPSVLPDEQETGQGSNSLQPSDNEEERLYQTITAAEALRMMEGAQEFIILDVRSPEEFQEEHIEGALLIPGNELATRAPSELPDKDALIFVYCRAGSRSAVAADLLASMGYTNIYDMGGIASWPLDTVSSGSQ